MKKFVIFTIVCTLMGAWTTAQAANYDLWVGGTQVTDANKGDVLGDGKVSYDPATLTLTLSNGASVAGTGLQSQAATGYGNGIYSLVNGLIITVEGTVTVSASTSNTAFNGIYLDGNTTITGNGSLTVTGSTAVRLYSSAEKLTVSGQVELAAEGDVSGLKGYYRQRTLSLARSTLIVKDKAMVRAKGSNYTFDGWKELILEDDHAITLPVGATWNAPKMTVCDAGGNVVADTWVFIASESVGYLGFAIGNVLITKENYAENGGGGKWSYDAEANVLHLNDGVIDPNGHSGLTIRGDLNPTLNISVDGKFSLSGVFTLGLVFTGNGTHTVYGKGTLNIEPRVIQPTSVAASGGKPNVTFKDLTVNVRQYGGVGFNNADFGSITFDWCDFIINTSDGFGLFGGMKATKPEMILCGDVKHSYGWDDNRGGGIKGNGEDEGLFASNVAIRRQVKYLNVAIDEPVPGQKPATTARALSPAYKVTQIRWWEVDGASGGLKYLSNDAVFEDNKAYFIEMGIEATGDSIIDLRPEYGAYRVFTVNGKVGESSKSATGNMVYGTYYFDEKFRITEVSLTGDPIAVGKNPPAKLTVAEGAQYTLNGQQSLVWEKYVPEDDLFVEFSPRTTTLEAGVTYRLTLPAIMSTAPYLFPQRKEDLTVLINGEKATVEFPNYFKKFIDIQCLFTFDIPANPADVNKDGTVDSADIVAVIKEMPDGDKKADVNNDGAIDSADIVAVIKAMK